MHKMPYGMWLIKDEELYRCKFCKENDPENPVSTPPVRTRPIRAVSLLVNMNFVSIICSSCLTDVRGSVSLQLARGAGHVTELSCTLHVHKNELHKTAEDRFVAL